MAPWPAPFLDRGRVRRDAVQALAYQAMTQYRLSHLDQARAALAELRMMGTYRTWEAKWIERWSDDAGYDALLREAEALIEGPPKK